MEAKLVIKNFGSIHSVDLHLGNVNVLIGDKEDDNSTIAKILAIVKMTKNVFEQEHELEIIQTNDQKFIQALEDYNIKTGLRKDTIIIFESSIYYIRFKPGQVEYRRKLLEVIHQLERLNANKSEHLTELNATLKSIFKTHRNAYRRIQEIILPSISMSAELMETVYTYSDHLDTIIPFLKTFEQETLTQTPVYIPAERATLMMLNPATIKPEIPPYLNAYLETFHNSPVQEYDLSFLQKKLKYVHNKTAKQVLYSNNKAVHLSSASTHIRNTLAILLPAIPHKHRSIIVEQPELHYFPVTQYALLKELFAALGYDSIMADDCIHVYTTNNPLILSAITNILLASKELDTRQVENSTLKAGKSIRDVYNILDAVKAIVPMFSPTVKLKAFEVKEGKSYSIIDPATHLIAENIIDEASVKLDTEFDKIINLIRQWWRIFER
ncbi:hypothetical protein LX64_02009 [Chitinophaga skermanii]|uniref:Uncharacterized protein n=1 Tax=Chitinophaga skermanii TaxID=331697 RepID=A0A327QRJ7_9BACT|nr:hypothetical protein [Chitinophaga skermanii]RAJ06881.1 hypothetical protein LX64_02009 [Chitinophaga skermanii]